MKRKYFKVISLRQIKINEGGINKHTLQKKIIIDSP